MLRRTEVATSVDGASIASRSRERPGGERTAKAAHDDVAATRGLGARRRRARGASAAR